MKTLSPLAARILPLLNAPMTFSAIIIAHAKEHPQAAAISVSTFDAALDELTPRLVTCDENGAGIAYYYRRNIEAEQAVAARWDMRRRVAEKRRDEAKRAADQAFEQAMNEADADRDAADPMAAIKAAASEPCRNFEQSGAGCGPICRICGATAADHASEVAA